MSSGPVLRCCQLLAGLGVLAEVTGQAGDVLGDEPADGAAGVDADDDPAAGVEDETGGLQVGWVGVDEGAGRVRDGGVGAVIDREPQAVPGDQVPVVASSSTDRAMTEMSRSARLSSDRWNALSWALQ